MNYEWLDSLTYAAKEKQHRDEVKAKQAKALRGFKEKHTQKHIPRTQKQG